MIRMPCQNRTSPIKLLRQHQSRQLMSHGHSAEGEHHPRRTQRPCSLRPSIRRPNRKNNMLRALIAPRANPLRKLRRSKLPPAAIQQHRHSRQPRSLARLLRLRKPSQKSSLRRECFGLYRVVGSDAVEIKASQRIVVGLSPSFARLRTDMCQRQLHPLQFRARKRGAGRRYGLPAPLSTSSPFTYPSSQQLSSREP
jgi:hypothetical protein